LVIISDEITEDLFGSLLLEASLLDFRQLWRVRMTRMMFIVTALVTAAVYSTQESSARTSAVSRHSHAQTKTVKDADCVRAPNVGAFASAPYSVPPCMPGTAN
jgi:hypothetical protein